MARLLIEALARAGHEVELAARFRSRLGVADPAAQARLAEIGAGLAGRLVRRYRQRPAAERPALWFTYHLYYKAPDWIGPVVCDALDLPYVVAEASFAPKRRDGPWRIGHQATGLALGRADAVVSLNSHDAACVAPVLRPSAPLTILPPFLDTRVFAAAARARSRHRDALARRFGLPTDEPWLLVVAMMREGDKLASYRALGEILGRLAPRRFRLLVAGDGPARVAVGKALAPVGADRIVWLGEVKAEDLPALYAAADLFPWPAVNEAYGMALLEAQAAGLPVVAGLTGGVPDIIADGETGILVPPGDRQASGDPRAFARALAALLDAPERLDAMRRSARARMVARHDIALAADTLDAVLARAARTRAVA